MPVAMKTLDPVWYDDVITLLKNNQEGIFWLNPAFCNQSNNMNSQLISLQNQIRNSGFVSGTVHFHPSAPNRPPVNVTVIDVGFQSIDDLYNYSIYSGLYLNNNLNPSTNTKMKLGTRANLNTLGVRAFCNQIQYAITQGNNPKISINMPNVNPHNSIPYLVLKLRTSGLTIRYTRKTGSIILRKNSNGNY